MFLNCYFMATILLTSSKGQEQYKLKFWVLKTFLQIMSKPPQFYILPRSHFHDPHNCRLYTKIIRIVAMFKEGNTKKLTDLLNSGDLR